MTDVGESMREPCVMRGAGGPPSPTSDFRGADGAADMAPARWTAPGVNQQRVLRVGLVVASPVVRVLLTISPS